MSSKNGSCQEVGELAVKFLGSLVLLCIANNVIALLCLPPPSFEGKEVHRSKRKREKEESEKQEAKEALEPASSREGGHPKSARSTHRSSSHPGGAAASVPRAHRIISSRATLGGGGGGGSGVSRRVSRRSALADGGSGVKRPEPSSSSRRRLQQQQQQEAAVALPLGQQQHQQRHRSGQPVAVPSRSPSPAPRGRPPRAPCPSKILILRATDSKGEVPKGSCGGGAGPPRGQVVYDARWLPCVLGEGGQAALLPQQLRELCGRGAPPAKRPGGSSPARISKEAVE